MRVKLFGLLLLFGIAGLLIGGCGSSTTTSTYYYPNWTADGGIICIKKAVSSISGSVVFPGKEEIRYYITTMNQSGTNEADIKEINRMGIVAASPLGNYIAVTEANNLKIFTTSGVDVKTIDLSDWINSFDWSPDESRIAYSDDVSKDLYILNISDEVKIKIASSAEGVAWKMGEKITFSFADSKSSKIYTINLDGSSKEVVVIIGDNPQITNDNRVVYQGYGLQVRRANISGSNDELLFDGYERSALKLSFDNTRIAGGDLDGSDIKGIWVYKIDGTTQKQLR